MNKSGLANNGDKARDSRYMNELPVDEMYRIYSEIYLKDTVENEFFSNEPPKVEAESESPKTRIHIQKPKETTSDGFQISRSIRDGKLDICLTRYRGSETIVRVPDYITSISMSVFLDKNIKEVVLPNHLMNIIKAAFSHDVLENISDADGFYIVGKRLVSYIGHADVVSIPEGIETIAYEAFAYNKELSKLYIPKSVKVIGNRAFYSCEHLTEVVFDKESDTMDCIGNEAFAFCERLRTINLPKRIKEIKETPFYKCAFAQRGVGFEVVNDILTYYGGTNETVSIPNGITTIGENAFTGSRVKKIVVPEGVTEIKRNAFKQVYTLEEIILPNSMERIDDGAFAYCNRLTFADLGGTVCVGNQAFCGCAALTTVIIREGAQRIESSAFENTMSMEEIQIPESVSYIGKDAFKNCKCNTKIVLPEALCGFAANCGIIDKSGCSIVNGVLLKYISEQPGAAIIPNGVVVIDESAFSLQSLDNKSELVLPDSVREIRGTIWHFLSGFKVNIPRGYLLQKRKLPYDPILAFLEGAWKNSATMLDMASIYLYQGSKKLIPHCVEAFKKAPNAFVVAAMVVMGEKCKPKEVDSVGEMVYDLRNNIAQEVLDRFYIFAKEKKAKTAINTLSPFVSSNVSGGKIEKTYRDDLEKLCDTNFEKHELDRIMQKCGIDESVFEESGVIYVEKGTKVPALVLECAILTYIGQLMEKPQYYMDYKTDYSIFNILDNCDQIASNFEKSSFGSFLNRLSIFAKEYEKPWIWIPICRFGSDDQVSDLISKMSKWSDWGKCGANGRKGIIFCRGAVMLSESRAAMMYAEKCKCLDNYAKIRGVTEEYIRDRNLADFGFDQDGKKAYDLGNTIIEATIGDDLTIHLYDTAMSKWVKSLPKKGSDTAKYKAASEDYAELKKNAKKVVKARNELLFEYFLSGDKISAKSWIDAYMGNPLLKQIAKLLVWAQDGKTFTLSETGAIDSYGNAFSVSKRSPVFVAHPMEMENSDLSRWQEYYYANKLKQPFEQIWEPVIQGEVEEDRYVGYMIPFYRLAHQEKHGIKVYSDFYYGDVDVYIENGNISVNRVDQTKIGIGADERFEIDTFSINQMNRRTNHIVNYFDKCTIFYRIEEDDASSLPSLNGYCVAQIDSFIKYATEKGSTKCTAVFLNFKNEHFKEYMGMNEYTLDL